MTRLKSKAEELNVVIQNLSADKNCSKELLESKKLTRDKIVSMMKKREFAEEEFEKEFNEGTLEKDPVYMEALARNDKEIILKFKKRSLTLDEYYEKIKEYGLIMYNEEEIKEDRKEDTENERKKPVKEDEVEDVAGINGGLDLSMENIDTMLKYNSCVNGFDSDYIISTSDGKYGIISRKGKEIVKPIYDEIEKSGDSIYRVKKGEKYGCIDKKGKIILPCEYDDLRGNYSGSIVIQLNGKHGIMDISGKEILPPKLPYEYVNQHYGSRLFTIGDFSKTQPGNILIKGIMNEKGQIIIPVKYEEINECRVGFTVKQNGKCGLIDKKGNTIIPLAYDSIRSFDKGNVYAVEQNGKWGFFDKDGNMITQIVYEKIDDFTSGGKTKGYQIKKDGKRGILDKDLKIKVSPKYDEMRYNPYNSRIFIVKNVYGYGVIDMDNKVILNQNYEDIKCFGNKGYFVKQNGKWGAVNQKGEMKISPKYDSITTVMGKGAEKYFSVKLGGEAGLIERKTGESIVLSDKYDEIKKILSDNMYVVRKGEKYGIVDNYSNELIPIEFDFILSIGEHEDMVIVMKDGKDGIMSDKGDIILPIEFDSIESSSCGNNIIEDIRDNRILKFSKDGKHGILYLPGEVRTLKSIIREYI